jgi:hypothetical protein
MELVEVDAIRLEPAQAALDRRADVRRARAGRPLLVDRHAELGREDDVLAARSECPAQEFLALGLPVDVGGVEQRDAGIERGVDDRARGGLVDPTAEVVTAEPDDRDSEVADVPGLHVNSCS